MYVEDDGSSGILPVTVSALEDVGSFIMNQ